MVTESLDRSISHFEYSYIVEEVIQESKSGRRKQPKFTQFVSSDLLYAKAAAERFYWLTLELLRPSKMDREINLFLNHNIEENLTGEEGQIYIIKAVYYCLDGIEREVVIVGGNMI